MQSSAQLRHQVTVELSIPALSFSALVALWDLEAYELASEILFGRISGARLPELTHRLVSSDTAPNLWIDMRPLANGRLEVAFHGAVSSPRYVAEAQGFHWDFSKVLNALVMIETLATGRVPVHAACLGTPAGAVLLPGASGAGKSSVSYAALAEGRTVYCSELGFLRGDVLECGNSAITIDKEAAARFQLGGHPLMSTDNADKEHIGLPRQTPVKIRRLGFLKVTDGRFRMRQITERRARMLLFENVVTQLPVTQLLAQETWPLWMPPARSDIDSVMETVNVLSALNPVIFEGHPKAIVEALCQQLDS